MLGADPSDFLGRKINGFEVDQEMVDGAQLYLDTIDAEALKLQETTGEDVEIRLEVFHVHQDNEAFGGTVDCEIRSGKSLTIVDYKYGAGVGVEVEGNTQLLSYSELSESNSPEGFDEVVLVVVQPRFSHSDGPVRSWSPTPEGRAEFRAEIVRVWNLADSEASFKAGEHCRWCPHKVNCQTLYQLSLDAVASDFSGEEISTPETGGLPHKMTPEIAAEILEKRKTVDLFFKSVAQYVHQTLEAGTSVPGLKLVEKRGNRSWAVDSEVLTAKAYSRFKLGKKKIFETKILSPAQMEKLTSKKFVSEFCESRVTGTTVVPESDKRAAVETKPLETMFEEINDE